MPSRWSYPTWEERLDEALAELGFPDDNWALINKHAELITDYRYDDCSPESTAEAIARAEGKDVD